MATLMAATVMNTDRTPLALMKSLITHVQTQAIVLLSAAIVTMISTESCGLRTQLATCVVSKKEKEKEKEKK